MNSPTKLPLHPSHPERICWGCNKHCPADDLTCGNGSERSPHPAELFGEDWYEWFPAQEGGARYAPVVAAVTRSEATHAPAFDALQEAVAPEPGSNVVHLAVVRGTATR